MNPILTRKPKRSVKFHPGRIYAAVPLIFSIILVEISSPAAAADKLLWDSWYTVTLNKKTPAQYYNERVELRKDKIYYQVSLWKREGDYINEEQLGEYSKNDQDVTPLFYNFHSVDRTAQTVIDGTVDSGKINVRIKKERTELPIVKRDIPKRAIFAQFFSYWLGKQLSAHALSAEKETHFQTILEDNLEVNFVPVWGSAKLGKPDGFALKTKTQKLLIDYHGESSLWWIDAKGETARIELLGQNAVVERVSKEKAKKFLDGTQPREIKTTPDDLEGGE